MDTAQPPVSISVVIPLFNKEDAVGRTIASVLRQTRLPDELIIVDDGSSDMSVAVAERAFAPSSDKIAGRVISQENAGVSAARNRGAEEARSGYIAFLDADDEWLPDYLEEIEKLAVSFPSATVLTTRSARILPDGKYVPQPSALPHGFFGMLDRPLYWYRKGHGIIHSSSIAIRKDAFQASGGFPVGVRKCEDVLLWLKLCMSETFAHSGLPLSLWHEDHTSLGSRTGVSPHHLLHYLGTEEGRRCLGNPDLLQFLQSNLLLQIGSHGMIGDRQVVSELRRLSAVLPLSAKLKCWAASLVPRWGFRAIASVRRRGRIRQSLTN